MCVYALSLPSFVPVPGGRWIFVGLNVKGVRYSWIRFFSFLHCVFSFVCSPTGPFSSSVTWPFLSLCFFSIYTPWFLSTQICASIWFRCRCSFLTSNCESRDDYLVAIPWYLCLVLDFADVSLFFYVLLYFLHPLCLLTLNLSEVSFVWCIINSYIGCFSCFCSTCLWPPCPMLGEGEWEKQDCPDCRSKCNSGSCIQRSGFPIKEMGKQQKKSIQIPGVIFFIWYCSMLQSLSGSA